jgi:hypothetical protein
MATKQKPAKVSITFSDREWTEMQEAVEGAMDRFDNGTWQMNGLRKLNSKMVNAWNAPVEVIKAAQ